MKTKSKDHQQITHPQTIIDQMMRDAIKPFAAELREAADRDRKLEADMDAAHPEAAKVRAAELLEAACAGDKAADAEIVAAGGTGGFVESRVRFFDLCRGKRNAAAKADAPLWEKVTAALLPALDAALEAIRSQWDRVLELHGEEPRPSSWEPRIASTRKAIAGAPFNARELTHGTNWQLQSLGLAALIDSRE